MPGSAPKRAHALYRRALAEQRLRRFAAQVNPEAVNASREFHLQHWLSLARQSIERDHRAAYYDGLQPNVENVVTDYPGDDLPPELQRAILADLAFMEGHIQAFREIMRLLDRSPSENTAA